MTDPFWRPHRSSKWNGPVQVEVFPSKDFTGTPQTSTQPVIADYQNVWWGAPDKTPRTVRYTASFKAGMAGKYLLLAAASGGDKYTVSVDGKPVLEQTQAEGQVPESARSILSDGQTVTVVADYRPALLRRPPRPRPYERVRHDLAGSSPARRQGRRRHRRGRLQ